MIHRCLEAGDIRFQALVPIVEQIGKGGKPGGADVTVTARPYGQPRGLYGEAGIFVRRLGDGAEPLLDGFLFLGILITAGTQEFERA